MPFGEEAVASLVFDFIHNSDFHHTCWQCWYYDSLGYTDRELARTCRLVCRDWARRLPIGDPKLTVTNGVVWQCAEEWQVLPKEYWAWVFQKIEWWVERQQLDSTFWIPRPECRAWYPKVCFIGPPCYFYH